jgi:hypothetical protein
MPVSSTTPERQDFLRKKIVDAVGQFDIAKSTAWSDLDALSSHTLLDGMETDPDGIIITDKTFKGPLSVYVVLQYDEKGDDAFETSDAFSGEFTGHIDEQGNVTIDDVSIDTSPFYESES